MAIKEIIMPALGESVHEATITYWKVKPGQSIEKYDVLAEVMSDKVTTEIPSEYSGTITELLVKEDEEVAIGTPILKIDVGGDAAPEPEDKAAAPKPAAEPAKAAEKPKKPASTNTTYSPSVVKLASEKGVDLKEVVGTGSGGRITKKDVLAYAEKAKAASAPAATSAGKAPANEDGGRFSPAVVKLANERGIDLNQVQGTGSHGRITRQDVLNFQPGAVQEVAPAATSTPAAPVDDQPAPTACQSQVCGNDEVVTPSPIRKAIAKHMVESYTQIPHAWLRVEVDVTNIVRLRKAEKDKYKATEGCSLTYLPFFIKAVTQSLKKHPSFNASWQADNTVVYHKDINISIAVANGDTLYVPVIHQADNFSISGLAKEIARLSTAVREGKASGADMKGGTFTVNNTGSFGSTASMGIINAPQVAILQVESIRKQMIPTKDGGFKVADMVNLCLSIDHRLLDGLAAGQFLSDIKASLAAFDSPTDIY